MSKTTNKQLGILLSLMEANSGVARGFYKGSKDELARFWQNSEAELNAAGPPTKSVAEWKKVWADQKKYVRQKAAQNLKIKNSTGGGPNTEQKFSPIEEGIYNLIAMKDSVEGVEVRKFRLGSQEILEAEYLYKVVEDEMEYRAEPPEILQPANSSSKPKRLQAARKPTVFKESRNKTSDILEAEIAVQRELLENIKVAVVEMKEQHQSSKKIYRSLDKIYDLQKNHFREMENLKKTEIDETRRHNAFMEKVRAQELEYKLEKIRRELEN